ncbi:MAG: hypothetical protein GWP91_16375 [Rhodobacterales bacterium]|nr:hypothetical protein [Rhodobacterales bacterium]
MLNRKSLTLAATALTFTFALTACGGDKDTDAATGTTTVTTNTVPTGDTGPTGPQFNDVNNIAFSGFFAYDESAGTIVDYAVDGNEAASLFIITLGTASYQGDPNDTNNYCEVWIDLAGYTDSGFAQTDGFLFGFLVPQGAATATSDCLEKNFDPEWFYGAPPEDSMLELAASWELGVAIGGAVSTDIEDYLGSVYTQEEIDTQFVGGEFVDTAGLDAGNNIYFSAFPVDGNMNVDSTAEPLSRNDIINGQGGLASGVYSFGMSIYWTFS